MKKRLSVIYKTAAAVSVLGIGLLLLISCSNIFAPPHEVSASGNGETGTAIVSFGNGVEGARTLLPSAATFALYKLTISPANSNPASTVTPPDISSGSSSSVELTTGDWTIHVDAYTDAGGTNKAAEGDSAIFTVSTNTTTPVSVVLDAVSDAGTGTLSIDITGEGGSLINSGTLYIYNGPDYNNQVTFYNGSSYVPGMSFGSGGLTLNISLPAGQYRVLASITNNDNQIVYINEVAYIYSNLTTDLDRVMATTDFSEMTAISGTVRYMENDVDQDGYGLAIYMNPEGHSDYFNLANGIMIYSPGNQPYEFRIPRPDKPLTLYFFINKYGAGWPVGSITLTAEQVSATKDISLNRSTITLSGTVAVTVGGSPVSYINLSASAYSEGEGTYSYYNIENSGSWSISGLPSDFSGTVHFEIVTTHDESGYSTEIDYPWTSGSPTTGINLGNIDFTPDIILSGTIGTVTMNGSTAYYVDIYARTSDDIYHGGHVESGNWKLHIPGDFLGTLTIEVRGWDGAGYSDQRDITTWTSGSAITGIDLGNISFTSITLSGTLGTVTIDGNTPTSVEIYAKNSDKYYTSFPGFLDSGNWQIPNIPSDFSGTLTIVVQASYNWDQHEKDVYTWTPGSSFTGINLGNISFISLISGSVTTNGSTPLSSGLVNVFDPSKMPDLDDYNHLLGGAEIINGAFSGYVDSGFTTGYVVIFDEADFDYYYVTPSPVTIGSSMSLNLIAMTKVPIPWQL
jgi:hypothetical protein